MQGHGVVLREHRREVFPPAALLQRAFGTDVEYSLKCVLGVFVNGGVIGMCCDCIPNGCCSRYLSFYCTNFWSIRLCNSVSAACQQFVLGLLQVCLWRCSQLKCMSVTGPILIVK